ncbi:Protein RTM1-like protein 2 [Colletotrichum chlorophyti]|uniref:Protein RTM1-like protein 2 n=1 Tax=Colletotrichum chlorophyti TaxID=708187 RepID=A0A1Q8RLS9_9PEZI|nr:Protein RTM1-like protein 2 [Colletotrichum chlorophyti]
MASSEVSIWPYNPSFPLAVLATVLYGLVFVWVFYLTVVRYRAWYFIVVVVGAGVEVSAHGLRSYSVRNQTEITPFVQTMTYTVLAPVLVAAGNYLLIGRLIRAVLPPTRHTIYKIPGARLTRLFVGCDVVAFLVQGTGSGIASGGNWTGTLGAVGTNVLVAGLGFQVLAFGCYMCVLVRFRVLAGREEREAAPEGWRLVLRAVCASSGLILLRSVFRVVEFAEGTNGYIFRNEWLFWVFEALPMLVAIGVFCVWHPSRYLGRDGVKGGVVEGEGVELGRENVVGRAGDSA